MADFYSIQKILEQGHQLKDVLSFLINKERDCTFLYFSASDNQKISAPAFWAVPTDLLKHIRQYTKFSNNLEFLLDVYVLHPLKTEEKSEDLFFYPMAELDKALSISLGGHRRYLELKARMPKYYILKSRDEDSLRLYVDGSIQQEYQVTRQRISSKNIFVLKSAIDGLLISQGEAQKSQADLLLKRASDAGVGLEQLEDLISILDKKSAHVSTELCAAIEMHAAIFIRNEGSQKLGIIDRGAALLNEKYPDINPDHGKPSTGYNAATKRITTLINADLKKKLAFT